MTAEPVEWRGVATGALLWSLLYLGVSTTLFVLFAVTTAAGDDAALAGQALTLGVVVTGLAFVAVIVDRLVFKRQPGDFLTRQSVWVIVLVGLTVAATGGYLATVTASAATAVLLGIATAVPTTMLLFAAINLARYRTMEHGN